MDIVRDKPYSYASSNRKNLQWVVETFSDCSLIKIIVNTIYNSCCINSFNEEKGKSRRGHMEYGCGEAGKFFEGINNTKIIKEKSLEIPKMLKDMFNDLCETMKMGRIKSES
ncbi:8306_t:CDS:2 [Acaulospora morrowiae]|uniref:8306_t:CDS:1 n=1 Tax=Acaulospora morrowiae TaxID=94023 RepID=A0A9N9HC40_9GLOM|nr:8306_t:CDS:2 [Acaulospora morrowiae]